MAQAQKSALGRGYIERANLIRGGVLNASNPNPFSKELPMGEGWYKMNLRVGIVLTVGTGSGPVTEGELLFIKNISMRTDRGEILCNLPGRALYYIGAYKTGQLPNKDAIAAASATYYVNLPIYFADPKMMRPEDTILDTARYNSVTLQVTLGSLSDLLGTPGTATATYTLDVEVERSLGQLPVAARPLYHISYDYRQPVDASNTTVIELEKSADMALKRMYAHGGASGTAGVPFSGTNHDDIQDIVTFKDQNRFIEKERIHEMIQDENKERSGLAAIMAGIEVFDFVADGSIHSALATGQKSVLQYTWDNDANVTSADLVTVATEAIRTLK